MSNRRFRSFLSSLSLPRLPSLSRTTSPSRTTSLSRITALAVLGALTAAFSVGLSVEKVYAQNIGNLFNLGGSGGESETQGGASESTSVEFSFQPASGQPGDVITATARMKIPEDSHTYSTAEGFSGRTRFIVETVSGLEAVDDKFSPSRKPKVKDDPLLGQEVEVHEGSVTWTRRYRIKPDARPAEVRLSGQMRFQVCDATSCRPKRETFELTLAGIEGTASERPPDSGSGNTGIKDGGATDGSRDRKDNEPEFVFRYAPTRTSGDVEKPGPAAWEVRLSPEDAGPGSKVTLAVTAELAEGFHTFALDQDPKNFGRPTVIQVEALSGLKPVDPESGFEPDSEVELHQFEGKQQRIHHDEVTWIYQYTVTDAEYGVAGKVNFQVCDATSCRPGRFSFELGSVSDGQTAGAEPAAGRDKQASSQTATVFDDLNYREPGGSATEATGFSDYLLFAFLGGLILNVMPCVLPVIAIKVLSFVQQAGEDRGRIFLLNFSYSLGVIAVFMLLATLAATAGLSWGGQFQSVEFLIAMVAVVFVMGLSLLGVFEIPIPGFVGASGGGTQEGLSGAFMTGIFATILATPCSGPFLGPTLGWSIQQSPTTIYLVWGMMGLGMASPYLLFGLFPGAVKFLPKPGNWMVRFKQFAGFVMLGTTVFLLSILDDRYVVPTLVMLLALGLGVWMIGNLYNLASPARTRWKVRISALVVIAVISGYGYHLGSEEDKLQWEPFSPSKVQTALESGRPVMVDFTADWCLTCKVVEKTTLNTTATRDLVDDHRIVTLKADWTDGSDEIRQLLNRLGGDSIPTLAVFSPAKPKEPIVLRDAWSQSTLLQQLETVGAETRNRSTKRVAMSSSPE